MAVEAGAITIKVSSTDSSFTEDLILVMTGWRDLDQDGFIDQFTIRASLGATLSLPEMTAQFTSNPPMLPGAGVSSSNLPVFAGGDSNRSPTSSEWNYCRQAARSSCGRTVSTLSMQVQVLHTSNTTGNTFREPFL